MGGRMVADGGSAPIGGRSEDACPYGSEKQAEVRVGNEVERADTPTQEGCRSKAKRKQPKIV